MTQDCWNSSSTVVASIRLPKGINFVGADKLPVSKVEGMSRCEQFEKKADTAEQPTYSSYFFLHHLAAKKFQKSLETYKADGTKASQKPFFVHQTFRYSYKNKVELQGVKKTLETSVSGLVFLQGTVKGIQSFLSQKFPQYHDNDRRQGCQASIKDSVMRPFMDVMKTHPEHITFLRDSFEHFARDHVKLRVLTGLFKGCEGYIVPSTVTANSSSISETMPSLYAACTRKLSRKWRSDNLCTNYK